VWFYYFGCCPSQKVRINTSKPHSLPKGGSKKHDKHTKVRPGTKKSPSYKPNPNKKTE